MTLRCAIYTPYATYNRRSTFLRIVRGVQEICSGLREDFFPSRQNALDKPQPDCDAGDGMCEAQCSWGELKVSGTFFLPGITPVLPVNRWMGDDEFLRDSAMQKPFQYVSPDGSTFIPAGRDFTTGAQQWGIKMADVLRAFGLAPAVAGRPFYVTNEAELKTWAFNVGPDGTLADPKLFVNEGGEGVAVDGQGNVYLAAGQILVFDPIGKRIGTIEVPQRPTSLIFGGKDRQTLFITARSSLYGVRTGSPGTATGR